MLPGPLPLVKGGEGPGDEASTYVADNTHNPLYVLAYRVITLCGEIHYYCAEITQQQQQQHQQHHQQDEELDEMEEEEEQSSMASYSQQSKFHELPTWHPCILIMYVHQFTTQLLR